MPDLSFSGTWSSCSVVWRFGKRNKGWKMLDLEVVGWLNAGYVDTQGDDGARGLTLGDWQELGTVQSFAFHVLWFKLSETSLQSETLRTKVRHFKVYMFPIHELRSWLITCVLQSISVLCIPWTCTKLHLLLLSTLAAVSSQQLEEWLSTGLMGNAKVEYHLRKQCLQWLNVTHMDENSFWDVYLYRLYSIILYWDPDYTNKQETKQGKQPKPLWGLWSQCFGDRLLSWKIGTRNLSHFWKVLTFLWWVFF